MAKVVPDTDEIVSIEKVCLNNKDCINREKLKEMQSEIDLLKHRVEVLELFNENIPLNYVHQRELDYRMLKEDYEQRYPGFLNFTSDSSDESETDEKLIQIPSPPLQLLP